jgi:hypothetical protein
MKKIPVDAGGRSLKRKLAERRRMKHRNRYGSGYAPWSFAPPFAVSKMGILAHRVKYAGTVHDEGVRSHDVATTWCGVQACSPQLFDDTGDRLHCEVCERNATANGLPSASVILGRHACVGRLVAINTCHPKISN